MEQFQGQTLSWSLKDGIIEWRFTASRCNEIGSLTLEELEQFVAALEDLADNAHAIILYSALKQRVLCGRRSARALPADQKSWTKQKRPVSVRDFLERIHHVMNAIDAAPLTTIAAVHGVTFGGGFELALVCDLIIADKMARFCFPELRLGLIPDSAESRG